MLLHCSLYAEMKPQTPVQNSTVGNVGNISKFKIHHVLLGWSSHLFFISFSQKGETHCARVRTRTFQELRWPVQKFCRSLHDQQVQHHEEDWGSVKHAEMVQSVLTLQHWIEMEREELHLQMNPLSLPVEKNTLITDSQEFPTVLNLGVK